MRQGEELYRSFLSGLIGIDTSNPPGNELRAAEYVAGQLGEAGLPCDIQEVAPGRANVITRYKGDAPFVLLTGHLDVVPAEGQWTSPPFSATEREGRIYGRGACDMKGGVACMMAAAIAAHRAGSRVPFRLGFVADEELYGTGTRRMLERLTPERIRFAVIGEPTMGVVCIAHRGAIRLRAKVRGRSCHAGMPQRGVNAIENAAILVRAIARANRGLTGYRHEVLPPPTLCATMIEAGVKDNVVPDEATVIIDCRPCPGQHPADFIRLIEEALREEGSLQAGAEVSFEAYIDASAGAVAGGSEIVRWAKDTYMEVFRREPRVEAFPACCDLSQFTEAGAQAILYGPGSLDQAHTRDEYVSLDELRQAYRFYCALLGTEG